MDEEAQCDGRATGRVRGVLTAAAITGLARWTPYVESEIRGLRELVAPGDVCIDVGAAAGLYTMVLSELAGPHGRVHSVEPLPFANFHLARLVNSRRATNVRCHAVAFGTQPGLDIMHVPLGRFGFVTGRSFLDRAAGGPDPNAEFADQVAVAVTVDTLDGFCASEGIDRLHFVKIDVEGAELQVLEGGKQMIAEAHPTLLIEIEARHTARYQRTPEEVTAWLFDHGYAMHTWQRGWQATGAVCAGTRNYLFRPPRRGGRAPRRRRERSALAVA